jgi:hypothetical protein
MLAEVRKYGTGLIIADQIPAKLIPDVIKNTHCKIVHRLFAEDDRRAMGESMMMDEAQRNFLPNLATGEAIVFCGGWHGPAHAAIRNDLAQTDNRQEFNLDSRSVPQLWRECRRYYPLFTRIGWLNIDSTDSSQFAQFVRSTRQAQNQLLLMISPESKGIISSDAKQLPRAENALIRLKNWQVNWQEVAAPYQMQYEQWREQTGEIWPKALLAAAWMALLLDANPRPHAKAKNVPTLQAPSEREVISNAIDILMKLLRDSSDIATIRTQIKHRFADDLRAHFEHLGYFRNF